MDKLLEKYNKSKFRKSHLASIAMLILIVGLVVLAFFLRLNKFKRGREITLIVISSILLISKTSEYIVFQLKGRREKIPMEFSQVSYYLFPISVLISNKTKVILPIGVFTAIMGVFYDISWVLFPEKFLEKDSTSQRIKALVNHNLLFFGALLVLFSVRLDIKYSWVIPLGIVLMIGWHYLIHALVKNEEDVVLKFICEAKVLEQVFPNAKRRKLLLFLYYFLSITLLLNISVIIYVVNHAFAN